MVQTRVKAAKLHIYYEVRGQDLRITVLKRIYLMYPVSLVVAIA